MTYRIGDHEVALEALDELSRDLRDDTYSPELNKLGRTLRTRQATGRQIVFKAPKPAKSRVRPAPVENTLPL